MSRLILSRLLRTVMSACALLTCTAPAHAASAALSVEGEHFVLSLPDGRRLNTRDLVGAELQSQGGDTIRIDAVAPAAERPGLLLHSFSIRDRASGAWDRLQVAAANGAARVPRDQARSMA